MTSTWTRLSVVSDGRCHVPLLRFDPTAQCKSTTVRSMAPGQISGCKVAGRRRGGDQAVQLAGRLVRADAAVRHLCQERCQLGVRSHAVLGAWATHNMKSPATVHHDHHTATQRCEPCATRDSTLSSRFHCSSCAGNSKDAANVQHCLSGNPLRHSRCSSTRLSATKWASFPTAVVHSCTDVVRMVGCTIVMQVQAQAQC